jgi:hypothetical protein
MTTYLFFNATRNEPVLQYLTITLRANPATLAKESSGQPDQNSVSSHSEWQYRVQMFYSLPIHLLELFLKKLY